MKILSLFFFSLFSCFVHADNYISPNIKVNDGIAITLDACGGKTDFRMLHFLIENKIASTIFVTGIWMKNNQDAINLINKHKDLFSIQNHGFRHKEAVLSEHGAYNLPTVKNKEGLINEIISNAALIEENFPKFNKPNWYRTAGALYDKESIVLIKEMNWNIAGYNIAADEGGKASVKKIYSNIKNAKNGDVILIHMNKPESKVYEGFVQGINELINKKSKFVFLNN